MRVEIKALAKRLTQTANAALERAAKDAAEKGHAEVGIDHVVLQLLSVRDEDAELLLAAAGRDRADARKEAMTRVASAAKGSGRPGFAASLWPWVEGAQLLASTELAQHRVRSGALLWAAGRHAQALNHPAGPLKPLADLDAATVRDALKTSAESSEAFDLDALEALYEEARADEEARVRGEIEKQKEEEAKAAEKAAQQAEATEAAKAAEEAEARAKAAAAKAAKEAWEAAEAAQAAKDRAAAALQKLSENAPDDEEE